VSVDLAVRRKLALRSRSRREVRLARRGERRRLARDDQVAARLAELQLIRGVLEDAVTVVSAGWVQHGWFAVTDDQGRRRTVTAHNLDVATGIPVSAACLVGSIVHAGGGPHQARSQLVQRTLDLTWHALYQGSQQPVRWCPAPAIRAAHVRDLTRWNDDVDRTAGQVTALLQTAIRTADVQTDLLRHPEDSRGGARGDRDG
jgi:hypothetical protein